MTPEGQSVETHNLVYTIGDKAINVGDKVKDFRGDMLTVLGWTSGEHWSRNDGTGRVHTNQGNFYPSVIMARIVPKA